MNQAVIYLRTSSITNTGKDKDSDKRQRAACKRYADSNGISAAKEFYDADVKGAQDHLDRPGFSDMIDHCFKNGVSLILCENADRFSRDLMTQEKGYQDMQAAGLTVVPVSTPDLFLDDTDNPSRTLIRQMIGSIVQYEKNSLVLKLKGARNRKRQVNKKLGIKTLNGAGKCEGRKSLRELDPQLVKAARKLLKWSERSGRKKPSLRDAAKGLYDQGYTTASGKPFSAAQIQRIVKR